MPIWGVTMVVVIIVLHMHAHDACLYGYCVLGFGLLFYLLQVTMMMLLLRIDIIAWDIDPT